MSTVLERRDRLIPWYFVMFFVGLVVVLGGFVMIAVRTQTGVVTDHPYEKGLAYNKVVAAAAAQEALGWKGGVEFTGTTAGKGTLQFTLTDKKGKPLALESAEVKFDRPTQAGHDFTVALTKGRAEVTFPEAGLWEARVFAVSGGKSYQQAKRIVVE